MTEWRNVICPVPEDITTAAVAAAEEWAVPVPEAVCTAVPAITADPGPVWGPALAVSAVCPMAIVPLPRPLCITAVITIITAPIAAAAAAAPSPR